MTENIFTIRPAGQEDLPLITDIGRQSFMKTFARYNTPENMATYLAEAFNPEKQAAEFARPGSLFLIAEDDGIPAGYAYLQAGPGDETCLHGRSPVELVRFYLLPAWIGKGYGKTLMQACLDAARKQGNDTIWLGVWEKNERAIRFYEKAGFERVGTHAFQLGSDLQVDFVLEKNLD